MADKTAMQMLIDKMNDAKNDFPAIGFDDEFVRGFNKAFQMACFIKWSVKPIGLAQPMGCKRQSLR